MVVAVAVARVVQVAVDEVVDVIAVGHSLMAAVWSVVVCSFVSLARVARLAAGRVGVTDGDDVLVDVVAVWVVQVTIVQVIDVIFVPNGRVTAVGAVIVGVGLMILAVRHGSFLRLHHEDGCSWSSRAWSSAFEISSTTCWSASV